MLLEENLKNSKEIRNIEYNYFNNSVKVYYKSGKVEEYENVPESEYNRLCEQRIVDGSFNKFNMTELLND